MKVVAWLASCLKGVRIVYSLGDVFGVRPNFGSANTAEFGLFKKGPIYVRSKAFFICKEKIIIFLSNFF